MSSLGSKVALRLAPDLLRLYLGWNDRVMYHVRAVDGVDRGHPASHVSACPVFLLTTSTSGRRGAVTGGRRKGRMGAYQSSRLNGKYSYSMSPFSMGLSPSPPLPPPPDMGLATCGLVGLPPPVRFGLRSSSDRDKLMGNVWPPVCENDLPMGRGPDSCRPDDADPSEDHAGTGGRWRLGDNAIFLVGWCDGLWTKLWFPDQSPLLPPPVDCLRQ